MAKEQEVVTGRTHNKLWDLGFGNWSSEFQKMECHIYDTHIDPSVKDENFKTLLIEDAIDKTVSLVSPIKDAISKYRIIIRFKAYRETKESLNTIVITVMHEFDFSGTMIFKVMDYISKDNGQNWNAPIINIINT